ncbi:MAG: 3',5'-cyclic-AMP phosphodiesterase [Synechococcales bacterium]|nr:3',5'-cyclic-AMP phosphodiesterase [Synechococcales bacterium]
MVALPAPALSIVQVTDTHLFANPTQTLVGISTLETLNVILQAIRGWQPQPDFLLLTGDLSQDGSPASYQQLGDLLGPLALPCYWLPGNHDHWVTMEQSLSTAPFIGDRAFVIKGWRFLLLNSQIPNEVPGLLTPETLAWLDQELQNSPELPTVIALHHPLFPLETDWLDRSCLQNPEDFFAVVDHYSQVKLVLFGHIHQVFQQQRHQVTYLGCPSTCVQFARGSATFTIDLLQPGFRTLDLYADGTWSTAVHRIEAIPSFEGVNGRGY